MQEIKNIQKSQDEMKEAMLEFIREVRNTYATKQELQDEIKTVKESKNSTTKIITEWIKF